MEAGDFGAALAQGLAARWRAGHTALTRAGPHAVGALTAWPLTGRALGLALEEARGATPGCWEDPYALGLGARLARPGRNVFSAPASTEGGAAGGQQPPAWARRGAAGAAGVGACGAADALELTFTVPWPLGDLLCPAITSGSSTSQSAHELLLLQGPSTTCSSSLPSMPEGGEAAPVITVYADIASALLRLRLCAAALQRAWMALGKPTAAVARGEAAMMGAGGNHRASGRLRAMRGWLSAALHWVGALQRHAQGTLLGHCWSRLEEALERQGPLDVEQIAGAHAAYLADAGAAAFLHPGRCCWVRPGAAALRLWGQQEGGVGEEDESVRRAVVAGLEACEELAVAAEAVAEQATGGGGSGQQEQGSTTPPNTYGPMKLAHERFAHAALAAYGALSTYAGYTPGVSVPVLSAGGGGGGAGGGVLGTGGDAGRRRLFSSLLAQLDCEWYRAQWAAQQQQQQ